MKKLNQLVLSAGLLAIAGSVQATMINFQGLANGSIGESAWTTFNTVTNGPYAAPNIDITSLPNAGGDEAQSSSYAYFDSGSGGLGVCRSLLSGATANVANAGSTANLCNPASDDNVDVYNEALVFTFNENSSINEMWFNNNHDGGNLTGNTILFSKNGGASTTYQFTAADKLASGTLGYSFKLSSLGWSDIFATGDSLTVAYDSSNGLLKNGTPAGQFYVSAMDVPEPGILALLGLGLVGIGFARRNKK